MQKRVLLITGSPGVGKTTLFQKVVDALKAKDIKVGGMVSMEVKHNNVRVGFEILDLQSGSKSWLAHVNGLGPRVGKYHVKLPEIENVGVKAIMKAAETCQVVAIDEIGPMELISKQFRKAVSSVLDGEKPVLAVVHAKAQDRIIAAVKQRRDAQTFMATVENREVLADKILDSILNYI